MNASNRVDTVLERDPEGLLSEERRQRADADRLVTLNETKEDLECRISKLKQEGQWSIPFKSVNANRKEILRLQTKLQNTDRLIQTIKTRYQ